MEAKWFDEIYGKRCSLSIIMHYNVLIFTLFCIYFDYSVHPELVDWLVKLVNSQVISRQKASLSIYSDYFFSVMQ